MSIIFFWDVLQKFPIFSWYLYREDGGRSFLRNRDKFVPD